MILRKELTDLLERAAVALTNSGPGEAAEKDRLVKDVADTVARLKDDEPEELNVVIRCHDEAARNRESLPMRVATEGYGVAVCALGDNGESLGEVLTDYFDNKLQVCVYHPDTDDPVLTHPLQDDVKKARAVAKIRARQRTRKRPE